MVQMKILLVRLFKILQQASRMTQFKYNKNAPLSIQLVQEKLD